MLRLLLVLYLPKPSGHAETADPQMSQPYKTHISKKYKIMLSTSIINSLTHSGDREHNGSNNTRCIHAKTKHVRPNIAIKTHVQNETSIPYFENAGARGLSRGVAAAPSLTGLRIPLRGQALRFSRRKLSFEYPDGAPLEGKLVLLKDSQ